MQKYRFLIVFLSLTCTFKGFAADHLDDSEFEDNASDEISLDDFSDETKPAKTKSASQEAPTEEAPKEEMTLEPLKGDENQVAEPTEAPAPEPTPEELAPPPPSIAEPEPTPEPAAPTVVDDSPDLAYESKLYDIFINFHSKKMTDKEWSQLMGARESETYKIQPGDTLWAISKTFFNDGNYWPKIWQLNSSITNPHLIKPGNTIRFLLGTESDTPAFAVTETNNEAPENAEANDEPVELPVGEAGAAGLNNNVAKSQPLVNSADGAPKDDVDIPPPSEIFPGVLEHVPPSLPQFTLQQRGKDYDESGIDYGRRPILDLPDKKPLESFVDEKTFKGDGIVSEIEGGSATAANYQYVFVSLPPGQGKSGDRYTVVSSGGRLNRVTKELALSNSEMGWLYQVQAEVKLQDIFSTVDGQDIFRALVVKSLTQVEKGSMVMRGQLPMISVSPKGERTDVMAQIIGANLVDSQETLSLLNLAFLSGGKSNGLVEGQILTVRANTRIRNSDSIIKESYIPVGLLKVVRVGERFTTAVVLKVWDAIFVGDVTGAGKVVAPEPPERRTEKKKVARAAQPEVAAPKEEKLIPSDFEGDSKPQEKSDDSFDEFDLDE